MKELHLSCIDHQSHLRTYGRVLLIFELENPKFIETATDSVRSGLAGLLHQFPYLAGVVEPVDKSSKRLKVSYPDSGPYEEHINRIFSVSTSLIEDPSFDYKALQAKNFTHETFPAEHFCPRTLIDHQGLNDGDRYATESTSFSSGVPLPALATQATFIRGGLVLSFWIYHGIADGTGWGRIFEVWANNVKRVQHGYLSSRGLKDRDSLGQQQHVTYGTDDSETRAALDGLARRSTAFDHTAYIPVQSPALRSVPYKVVSRMFRIRMPLISDLKIHLSEKITDHTTNFIALAALLATYISEARSNLLSSHNVPKTTLAVVVNLRTHLSPKFTDPDFIGNCMLSAKSNYQLSTSPRAGIASPSHLAPFAHAIAESIKRIDEDWVSNRLAPILLSSPPALDNSDLRFGNGPDLYITSWQHMGADTEWNIPGTKEGRPIAIRRDAWESEGGIVILPKRMDDLGDFEVMVSLAEDDMRAFEEMMRRDGWVKD
ncbi:hypothetical protein J1614_000819 [Plenodomus biglobosus]|nr:hypothetical protein J1614_000819 [Plenodomus biglobosus]